jgi:agmatine/peptidylarginine deiminase
MTGGDAPAMPQAPRIEGGALVFPEGVRIPADMTTVERRWLDSNTQTASRGETPPSADPIRCASEYEAMDGIVLAWEGGSSYTSIVAQMAAHITTTGNANVYVACDSNSEASTARNSMISQGADSSRIFTVVRSTDTIWIRDYGPRYIFEGNCRAVVDHTYNRPRPNDDAFNEYFASWIGHGYYRHALTHGGGNYHVNSVGNSAATRLINNENPQYSESQIWQIWKDYQNVDTEFHTPFPTSVDSTQHIDMWMEMIGDDEILISDWPSHSGSTQDNICDGAAAWYAAQGWTVHRTPAYTDGWTHYTFTNMVICNDLVLLPKYNSISSFWSSDALAAVASAMPDKTIVQIVSDNLAYSAGVMHCICMHVPANAGGVNPTAYLRSARGGDVWKAGDSILVRWNSDDDVAATSVDLLLSTDGGANYDTVIVFGTADDGTHSWNVPDLNSDTVRIKVVVHDADGNTGSDASDADNEIIGTIVPGDVTGDGHVGVDDLLAVIADWGCLGPCTGDATGDGTVGVDDLLLVIANWGV